MQLRAIRIVEGTKITHDHWEQGDDFSYDDLLERSIPAVGIPAVSNNLVIIDVDAGGAHHKYDGRDEWGKFAEEAGIPETYVVQTPSGGYHFYFKLPESLNKTTFKPRGTLFPGVDVRYKAYVLAPPTKGYEAIHGTHDDIAEAPVSLLRELITRPVDVDDLVGNMQEDQLSHIHTPLSQMQLDRLKKQIEWVQLNADLSYDQWYRGLVALKAGIPDEETLEELAVLWTRNRNYSEGDEEQALDILKRTDRFGAIGPGTIFEILKDVMGESDQEMPINLMTKKDIIDMAGVPVSIDKSGLPKINPNESNIAAIIDVIPQFSKERLYYDIRMDSYIYDGEQIDDQTITDIITPVLQSPKDGLGFGNFRRTNVSSAVQILMTARRRDPHVEWLNSLEWDGVPRIDAFFPRYVMTEDTVYTRTLGRNLWIALAARGIDPGCKMDNIIILEGKEGLRKSSLVEAIGGKYYMSLSSDERLNSAEALRKMHQSTVVEIPELVGLINREGEAVKAILTTSRDRLRGLYARKSLDRRRGFIFIGTTNSGEYLMHSMGERRFWPTKIDDRVDGIDLVGVKTDRAQLFAEGVARYRNGESYWEMPETWHEEIDQRKMKDPLAPVVEEVLQGGAEQGLQTHWRLDEIYQVLNHRELLNRGLNKRVSDRLTAILKSIDARYESHRGIDGKLAKKWTLQHRVVESGISDLI